jgi:hypothetical protein
VELDSFKSNSGIFEMRFPDGNNFGLLGMSGLGCTGKNRTGLDSEIPVILLFMFKMLLTNDLLILKTDLPMDT